jgi:hypothetical protein
VFICQFVHWNGFPRGPYSGIEAPEPEPEPLFPAYFHVVRVPEIEPERMCQAREKGGMVPPNYSKGILRLPFPAPTNTNIYPYPLYMAYLYLLCKRVNLPEYIR